MINVLLIDDDKAVQNTLSMVLSERYNMIQALTGEDGMKKLIRERVDAILLDIDLPDTDGLSLLGKIISLPDPPPVIMLTVTGNTRYVVRAIKEGAYDYIVKPYRLEELEGSIRKAVENRQYRRVSSPSVSSVFDSIIGISKAIENAKFLSVKYSVADATILLRGESGTGKELFANAIHRYSGRKSGPFVPFNCGAIPDTLIESELFGTARGAYTDATSRPGLFEAANEGTLFLDEIGELSPRAQVKLLRVLEEKRIKRLGGTSFIPVNVRIITATNRHLEKMVREGKFREDLFYRISILPVDIPALRNRKEDIPLLSLYFIAQKGDRITLSEESIVKLTNYHWPGNVRQLKNTIVRATLLCDGKRILPGNIVF